MRHFIQRIILSIGLYLLLMGLSAAQVLTNTASGELNNLSLDLSSATVILNRTVNTETGAVSVIAPNQIVVSGNAVPATLDVDLEIAAIDTEIRRLIIQLPEDHTNYHISTLTVAGMPLTNNCPIPGTNEFCWSKNGKRIFVDLGSRICVGTTRISFRLVSDAANLIDTAEFNLLLEDREANSTVVDIMSAESAD